jgi:hypothetical protein
MLSHRVCYNDLGDLYRDKLNKHHLTRNLVHRLERLGYTVMLGERRHKATAQLRIFTAATTETTV